MRLSHCDAIGIDTISQIATRPSQAVSFLLSRRDIEKGAHAAQMAERVEMAPDYPSPASFFQLGFIR